MQETGKSPGLSDAELVLLRWLLPAERPGYNAYFEAISNFAVLGAGRWGRGDYILGEQGARIDISGPMERVYAFGSIQYPGGRCTISVHERAFDQIEVQFAVTGSVQEPSVTEIVSQYCYSYWQPGDPAPKSETPVRQAPIDGGQKYVLVISPGDERIWLYERGSGVNHLIPHMKFHNELMRQIGTRDKEHVFHPKLVFEQPERFDDATLRSAFLAYNKSWTKVELPAELPPPDAKTPGFFTRLFKRT